MLINKLKNLRSKLFFSSKDVADVLGIKQKSALVTCNRYIKSGLFLRLKRDFYVLEESWGNYTVKDKLKLSNFLQVPSYVSLTTALAFYDVTTQVQQDYFESVCLKRTARYSAEGAKFRFYAVNKKCYSDFIHLNGVFIALKEKAFLDAVYLSSFGKYKADFSAIDMAKLDTKKIIRLSAAYPEKTKRMVKKLCGT